MNYFEAVVPYTTIEKWPFLSVNKFYNSMEDWCVDQNLFSALKSLIKEWVHDVSSVWGRWIFTTKRTNLLLHEDMRHIQSGEWFLTFFVHTDFYSFTTCKSEEIYLRIYCKPWDIFSWYFEGRSITVRITNMASFSSIRCTVFEKMTIITYTQFEFFSKSVMWVFLMFGMEMH